MLYGGVIPEKGSGEKASVGSVCEEELDEGDEYGDDVADHDEDEAEP